MSNHPAPAPTHAPACDDPTGGLTVAYAERAARFARMETAAAVGGDVARWRAGITELAGHAPCDILSSRLPGGSRLYPVRCGNPGEYVSGRGRSGVMCEGHARHYRAVL